MSPHHTKSSDTTPEMTEAYTSRPRTPDPPAASPSGSQSTSPVLRFLRKKMSGVNLNLKNRKSSKNLRSEATKGSIPPTNVEMADQTRAATLITDLRIDRDTAPLTERTVISPGENLLSPSVPTERSSSDTIRPPPAAIQSTNSGTTTTEAAVKTGVTRTISPGATGILWEGFWEKELRAAEVSAATNKPFCWEKRYHLGAPMFREQAEKTYRSVEGFEQAFTAMLEYKREKMPRDWTEEMSDHLKLGLLLEYQVYGQILSREQRSHIEARPPIQFDEKTGKSVTYLLASQGDTLTYDPYDTSAESFGARGTRIDLMFPSDEQSKLLHQKKHHEMVKLSEAEE